MSDPVIFQKAPMPVDVEKGKTYFWCACGKSAKQPFVMAVTRIQASRQLK